MNFGTLLTAIVTPFNELDHIDQDAFELVINHVINQGSDAIIVAGTTGESPTLTTKEKEQLFELAVEIVNKRIPVIAGTGTYNTEQSVSLTKRATKIGVDGVMAVTPYYNRPSQQGLYAHFCSIAEATDLPLMLYHIPSRTSVHLDIETIIRLSTVKNIRSLKDAAGNLGETTHILKQTDPNFIIYSGDDAMTLPYLSIGSHGVVSVAAHVIGEEMNQMIHAFHEGNVQQAANLHKHLTPLIDGLFTTTSPTLIKEMLNQINIPVGSVRLPLVEATESEKQTVRHLIRQYNIG